MKIARIFGTNESIESSPINIRSLKDKFHEKLYFFSRGGSFEVQIKIARIFETNIIFRGLFNRIFSN